jgi:hypothetical protein
MIEIDTLDVLKVKLSPELVVFAAVKAPAHRRRGVPVVSKTSTPLTVTAGMFEYVIPAEFAAAPEAAALRVIVARAYEPPEISVPADVFVPVVESSASLTGVVTAGNVVVPTHASRS